jgi:FdhD protein
MGRVAVAPIRRFASTGSTTDQDLVAVEAPLAVELIPAGGGSARAIGVLMRTPGDDLDLIRGWLFTERIIRAASDISGVEWQNDEAAADVPMLARVTLANHIDVEQVVTHRTFTPTSACGLCGRLAIDRPSGPAARGNGPLHISHWPIALIATLPAALRTGQRVFDETGGLHAAGFFDGSGQLLAVREDVGRHNAVDKLIGASLGQLDRARLLVVSGRVAFEIVLKAVVAGLEAVVAVGAPSDLAVEAARTAGLTLVGFARDGRFNVYTGADRIDPLVAPVA